MYSILNETGSQWSDLRMGVDVVMLAHLHQVPSSTVLDIQTFLEAFARDPETSKKSNDTSLSKIGLTVQKLWE